MYRKENGKIYDIPFSMPKGFMDMEILTLLKKPMHGYELMKIMREHFKHWKPSPGSVYPLLRKMERKGCVERRKEGRKNVYSITVAGKKHLKEFRDLREGIRERMITIIALMGEKTGSGMMKNFTEARKLLWKIEQDPKKKPRMKKIIFDYIHKLKKLADE